MSGRTRAAIGLGSNVGDPEAALTAAVAALTALPDVRVTSVSRLYATAPVGVEDQAEFRNAAVLLDVPAGPDPETGAIALLVALKSIERAFGRRDRGRWGPREIDLDLLLFDDAAIRVERPEGGRSVDPEKAPRLLEVPHALAGERLFVLAPLADIVAEIVPPGWHETVGEARDRVAADEPPDAVRSLGAWDAEARRWEMVEGST
ncbi:MAG: 2-amino-4-hydroxy-6-hydroxymethyldihydropteridine diphosphokinase [Chloroflexi bacterium]|jgi:2-amino-4-hydroxy-6-hydroxymethyldihydropteridine diphosphokinase|nr:2-amino-4-hydroxy-6-hydroxymethyldihydropteridine diphosphokinase [Chloroflexota bacterium]